MQVSHTDNGDGSIRVVIDISAPEVVALKHDLPGIRGVVDWFSAGPAKQKIVACAERLDNQWRPKLDGDPEVRSIPANREARIAMIVARPDYLDREARDAAQAADAARRDNIAPSDA